MAEKKEQTFNGLLAERAEQEKLLLVTMLIEKAKTGDATAIKALNRALEEGSEKSEKEEDFPLTDEQFNRIILIRAKRITGVLTGGSAELEAAVAPIAGEAVGAPAL